MARGSLFDAERLVAAVTEAGGGAPAVLVNILATRDLLNAHSAQSDPAWDIVRAGAAGELTDKKLAGMLVEAAQRQQVANFTGDLRARVEPLLTREFAAALKAGAADELITSLRPQWDGAVAFIGRARAVISPESSTEHFLASTDDPDAIKLWRGLDAQLRIVSQIAAITSQFGPRIGPFPMIAEFSGADGHLLEDRAIFCTDGPITVDSSLFRRPDTGHKGSPWFRLPLKLHSVASATARYREFAADCWDRNQPAQVESWIDEQGNAHEKPRPVNPYREKVQTA